MKELMLGNKAVARGLYEAGCAVVSSYPGTPSTVKLSGKLVRLVQPSRSSQPFCMRFLASDKLKFILDIPFYLC